MEGKREMQGGSIHKINGFAFSFLRVFSNPETFFPEKREYIAPGIHSSLTDEVRMCYVHRVTG